jgi:hypothetical protein
MIKFIKSGKSADRSMSPMIDLEYLNLLWINAILKIYSNVKKIPYNTDQ